MAKEETKAKVDRDSKEYQQKMYDRAEALADSLIDVFSYTDAQLVCSLTLSSISQKLMVDKLDGIENDNNDNDNEE